MLRICQHFHALLGTTSSLFRSSYSRLLETVHWWNFWHLATLRNSTTQFSSTSEFHQSQHQSSSNVNFLDCTVFKHNNHLATKIHSKPADSHRLLHFNSCHPRHVFENIVKAQILRFIRLSSHSKDFLASYLTLKSLLQYVYPRS